MRSRISSVRPFERRLVLGGTKVNATATALFRVHVRNGEWLIEITPGSGLLIPGTLISLSWKFPDTTTVLTH